MDTKTLMAALRGEFVEKPGDRLCAVHGGYTVRTFATDEGKYVGEFPAECPACKADAITAAERSLREAKLREDMQTADIPLAYLPCTFRNYLPTCPDAQAVLATVREYAKNFADHRKVARSMTLQGSPGTGKTHLGVALLKAVMWEGGSGRYSTMADMVQAIRSTWSRSSSDSEAAVIRRYTAVDLLVLDEVDAASSRSDNEVGLISNVIDQRSRNLRPTVISGNVTKAELLAAIGDRAADRMRDHGGLMVVMDWSSYRGVRKTA
ncbi:ATP-binding protein [Nevskia ramosa]|uniref:ATP-binding protein n=1 Tax=Nevskia ramosa TaxID=64002 RepID=UPI003D0A8D05